MIRLPTVSYILFTAAAMFPIVAFSWPVDGESDQHTVAEQHGTEQQTRADRIARMAAAAAPEPDMLFSFNALDPAFETIATENSLFDPSDDYWGLPREEGYEEVAIYCSACHSLGIVMQQKASFERWQELLVWMVDKQGMAPMPQEDEQLVLEYLSVQFTN